MNLCHVHNIPKTYTNSWSQIKKCLRFLSSDLTFGTTKSHNQWAVALVKLPEAGSASSVSDDGQLSQDESLLTQKKTTIQSW